MLRRGGTVACWGDNATAVTGADPSVHNPVTSPYNVRMPPDAGVVAVTTGGQHSCAVGGDGALWCWGEGTFGQLGPTLLNSTVPTPFPVNIPAVLDGGPFSARAPLAATTYAACAGAGGTDGGISCWGIIDYGQVGVDPEGGTGGVSVPRLVASGALALGSGADHTCAAVGTGVVCWGNDTNGALGSQVALGGCGMTRCAWSPQSVPVPMPFKAPATSIAGGTGSTCIVDTSGAVFCWGDSSSGQTGDVSTLSNPSVPHQVALPTGAVARAVAAGNASTCVLAVDGSVYCFGANDRGQLGAPVIDGGVTTPTKVPGVSGATAVAVGDGHACAIVNCGEVTCWGANDKGQLGDGTTDAGAGLTSVVAPAP